MLGHQWHVASKSWCAHAHVAYLSYLSCLVVCCSSSVLFVWVGGQKSRASKKRYLRKYVCSWPSMTAIASCCFLLCMCVCVFVCVCVCSIVCCVVPSFQHHIAPSGTWNKGIWSILYSNLLFLRWTQNQLKKKHNRRQINLRCHDACFIFDNSCYSSWFLMGLVLQVPDYLFGFPSSSHLYIVFWILFGWLSLKLVNVIFEWFKIGAGL